MSYSTVRDEMLARIAEVGAPYVGHKYVPTDTTVGDAWPLVEYVAVNRHTGNLVHWQVIFCVSSDIQGAEDKYDELIPRVDEAFEDVMTVTDIRPQSLRFEDGRTFQMLIISGTREE